MANLRSVSAPADDVRKGHDPVFPMIAASVGRRARLMLVTFERPWFSGLVALLIYALYSPLRGGFLHASVNAYYNYLADAFLHGQLHLRVIPPSTHDLTLFHGQYFLYWSPMPAVLMLPLVAIFGPTVTDSVIAIGIGAANVALMAMLLRAASRRNLVQLSEPRRALLVLFFAFGTVHFTLAPYANVWSSDELVGFFFVMLAYLAAIELSGRPAFALTGLALAAAMLTRNHLVLAGVWPALLLISNHRTAGIRRIAGNLLIAAAPILAGVLFLAWYDFARFGSIFENGISYHLMDKAFINDFHRYGYLNPHYIPVNLYYQYIFYPFPIRHSTPMGGSLFLLSPVFFGVFWGIVKGRPRWSVAGLLASILLVSLPILLLMGTGWKQFGPRYTLDFTAPLMLLTALGVRRWPGWLLALCTTVAMLQFAAGTYWFGVM